MLCAIYVRAATRAECETQLAELRDYVSRRGWTPYSEYVDVGAARPRLAKLMEDARLHHFDIVLVSRLDRWGRSLTQCLSSIHELCDLGIRWMSLSEGLNLGNDDPQTNMAASLLAALQGFRAEVKRENVKASMRVAKRQAKRRGEKIGRPKRVFDRERVSNLRKEGKSIRAIAAELGVGRGTVERILRGS